MSPWRWLTLLLMAALVASCSGPTHSHRYRLTIEVETPDGPKSGSSVIEAAAAKIYSIDAWNSTGAGVVGEAVFVDLGGGRNLVALLAVGPTIDTNSFPKLANMAFARAEGVEFKTFEAMESAKGSVELPNELIPTFVTFTDINDPKSASLVAPDDLVSVFGPGYRLTSARIEMTDEPVTRGIEQRLVWLENLKGNLAGNRRRTESDLSTMLDATSFRRRG